MFALAAAPAYSGNSLVSDFNRWKSTHAKKYDTSTAEANALAAFASNDAIIREHNAQKLSYELGHNKYSDLTWDVFHATVMSGGLAAPARGLGPADYMVPTGKPLADSIDWVAKGAVTPIKDQARCGSCWAFSTTGSVEGGLFLSSGKLTSLSEQDLVSCDHGGDQGCQGGLMDNAFKWIEKNGICSEADYPYSSGSGSSGTCKSPACSPVATLTGFKDVPARDENALKEAIGNQPVSVAIEADKSAFQLYKSGILDSASCGTRLDHGVLAVGYGTDAGKDYYKVKNSWGATWGEDGFVRMVQGKNMCGIASQASYPTGVTASSGLGAAPAGAYCGSVPVILDDKITFNGDSTVDFHINVKIAKQVVDCKAEKVTVTASDVHFTDIASTGDCMGDALRGQGKDPTKYFFDINADNTLTFHSDGYPDLKMKPC